MLRQRKANRMRGYDYSRDALYFVTSCVKHMRSCFGKISEGEMHLNAYGKIARRQWDWLAKQYSYVILHASIIMPNHMHGIIEINRDFMLEKDRIAGSEVRAGRDQPVPENRVKIKSLSELMGAYKTTVSKQIHLSGFAEFAWHRSFYDHIIRNERAYHNISAYIRNNPLKWEEDKFYHR